MSSRILSTTYFPATSATDILQSAQQTEINVVRLLREGMTGPIAEQFSASDVGCQIEGIAEI
jgi:hypothetical protein